MHRSTGTASVRGASACAALVLLFLAVGLRADTLILNDGRKFEGKLLSKDEKQVVFEIHRFGAKMAMTFEAKEVAKLVETDESDPPDPPVKPPPDPPTVKKPPVSPKAQPKLTPELRLRLRRLLARLRDKRLDDESAAQAVKLVTGFGQSVLPSLERELRRKEPLYHGRLCIAIYAIGTAETIPILMDEIVEALKQHKASYMWFAQAYEDADTRDVEVTALEAEEYRLDYGWASSRKTKLADVRRKLALATAKRDAFSAKAKTNCINGRYWGRVLAKACKGISDTSHAVDLARLADLLAEVGRGRYLPPKLPEGRKFFDPYRPDSEEFPLPVRRTRFGSDRVTRIGPDRVTRYGPDGGYIPTPRVHQDVFWGDHKIIWATFRTRVGRSRESAVLKDCKKTLDRTFAKMEKMRTGKWYHDRLLQEYRQSDHTLMLRLDEIGSGR